MIVPYIQSKMEDYGKWIRLIGTDSRLLATHVSLFTALFICWQRSGFASPFAVTRRTLMAFSKIASIVTYHKCMRELHEYGYIRYQPSYHRLKGAWCICRLPKKQAARNENRGQFYK